MVLTIRTTHRPATDLGYLLMKHPDRAHRSDLGFGTATVFFPEATEEACTAALVLEIDPVGLVRGRRDEDSGMLDQYVNDRPYSANSFFITALRETMASALNGRSREKPELAETAIPLEAHLPALRVRGGEAFARSVFEPLGYDVEIQEPHDADWGVARHLSVTLRGTLRLADLLSHLYVLIPALDGDKHYYLDQNEIEKLLKRGENWLPEHPLRDTIVRRYLRPPKLANEALSRLIQEEEPAEVLDDEPVDDVEEGEEEKPTRKKSLHAFRLEAARDQLIASGAAKVLDLGCGEGRLLRMLLAEKQFTKILGMDVSLRTLREAQRKLRLERRPAWEQERIELVHGSLVYRDRRLEGYDAAAVVEVIEHLDPPRLRAFERSVFEFARPGLVVVTTPNREYNARYPDMEGMRHSDHRFEWDRTEFRMWCEGVASRHEYAFEIHGVGDPDEELGAPSQMAVFRKS
ncbi:3' terminal RNA ribose 2'-O-methyltransferase Hen1 [bacterium]|nr:MAG: 3' terminal RNA ribose 2'-O-methyltransferase Hen1 [bacterium]